MKTRFLIIIGIVMSSLLGYVQHVDAEDCAYVNRNSPCIDPQYIQPSPSNDNSNFTLAELSWKQAMFPITNGTGFVTVILNDPDLNGNANYKETAKVFVYSDSDRELHVIELQETENNSGIFDRKFGISNSRSAPNVIFTQDGDTITVMYIDSTMPPGHFGSDSGLISTALIGSTGPPLERLPASNPRIVDLSGNQIDSPNMGEQVLLTSDIVSQEDHPQEFIWIAQTIDSQKRVQSLSWINGTINPQSSFSPSTSWIPEVIGDYKTTFFVWESIDNPTALSPPVEMEYTVVKERHLDTEKENED